MGRRDDVERLKTDRSQGWSYMEGGPSEGPSEEDGTGRIVNSEGRKVSFTSVNIRSQVH